MARDIFDNLRLLDSPLDGLLWNVFADVVPQVPCPTRHRLGDPSRTLATLEESGMTTIAQPTAPCPNATGLPTDGNSPFSRQLTTRHATLHFLRIGSGGHSHVATDATIRPTIALKKNP
jgi:hypothetical protein